MVLGGNNQEILNEIIKQQKIDNKRIERLETLEFEKASKSNGCIGWLDYEHTGGAIMTVSVPPNPFELGDYGWTHLTVFYGLYSTTAGDKTLHLTYNAVVANYGYTYKYMRGGAQTIVSADAQASLIIANLRGTTWTVGSVYIPFFPIPLNMVTYGDWVCRDASQEVGSQVEKGECGGMISSGNQRIVDLHFFGSADNIGGYIYLYGWCPTWDITHGPPD